MKFSLHNIYKNIITEGAESRNMGLAKHYLYDKRGMNEEQAMNTIGAIKTDIPNVRLAKCKFILGVTRMFCDGQLSDYQSIRLINKYLRYIASNAHINEYDQNLNNMSLEEIDERFGTVASQDLESEKYMMSLQDFKSIYEYNIVPIDSFEESSKYGDYTEWCVTQDEKMFDSYTQGGLCKFYFCLREDFKQVEREPSEGCPLDDYGLSMIAVSVDMDGSCNTITCRWNHKNGGNDSIMTPKELSNIIGKNFYETFLPYTEEELAERKAKKCNSLFKLYQDYVAWDISEMIDIERHFNNSYDEDKDAYYDEDEGGYVTEYENEYKEALESKDDINDISGDWSVVAYAGFKDNSDISEDEPPCILINTEKNSIIVNDLFDFDSEFYMMSNFAVGTLYGRKGVKVIVDTDKMSYLTNDVYSNVFFTHRNLGYGAIAIVYAKNKTVNILLKDGSYLLKEWFNGGISEIGNGFYSITSKDKKRGIMNSNGEIVVSDIDTSDTKTSDAQFTPFYDGGFTFIRHSDGITYAYSKHTYEKYAPWSISELLGIQNKQMKKQSPTGYSYKYESFYKVRLTDGQLFLLDKECNLCDLNSCEIVKQNPYFKDSNTNESIFTFGNLLEEAIVRFMLSEGSNIWDIYEKYYNGKISKEDFKALNDVDPTSKGDNKGKYLPWLIKYYLKGEINLNSNISSLLQWYDSHKSLLDNEYKDIMRMTPSDLTNCYNTNNGTIFNKEDIRSQIEKVYEDDEWIIYIPYTYNASRYLVWHMLGGSEWCTAAQGSGGQYYFDHYTENGNHLYVNVRKKDGEIFQYAPLTEDYMDRHDEPLTIEDSMMSEGAIKWYKDNGISLEVNANKFPVGDDIYDGGYWGLKCINDLYAEYKVCDQDGNIIEGLPQIEFPSIRYETEDCIITSTSSKDGSCIFALPNSKFYEYINDDNRLYFESTFNDDDSKFMFVNDDEKVFIYNLNKNKMEFEEDCTDISFFGDYICIYTDYSELYIFGKSNLDFKLTLNGDYFNFFDKDKIEYTSSEDGETHVFNLTTMEDIVDNN